MTIFTRGLLHQKTHIRNTTHFRNLSSLRKRQVGLSKRRWSPIYHFHAPKMAQRSESLSARTTQILSVDSISPPDVDVETDLSTWFRQTGHSSPQAQNLLTAVSALHQSSIPVAFPTETVYGLGADATRSDAVKGIYQAKQRPSDNPLIVHVGSLPQLRKLIRPSTQEQPQQNGYHPESDVAASNSPTSIGDPIPAIYHPLIERFWPGPVTILLPLPHPSPLAPEVSGKLSTFGVRMPSSPLARLFISLTDRPLAAPSANASTRPSPTTAQHVYADLKGRIDIILDGGPCTVGVESTVVDGLSDPPAILRPGGIGIEEIRALGGKWTDVTIGYQDRKQQQVNGEGPRAPGMKYKHYSPSAAVYLFEAGTTEEEARTRLEEALCKYHSIGIIRTRSWREFLGKCLADVTTNQQISRGQLKASDLTAENGEIRKLPVVWSIDLGGDVSTIAQGLFSALRSLDEAGCEIILIEGISDTEGDLAAAIMNRLRKAAEVDVK